MACDVMRLPGGATAIICSSRRHPRCACGRRAPLLCDWKMPAGGTCDAPICRPCATAPAPDKDLCPTHARAWAQWQAQRAAGRAAT
jgi:hypothetical protein